MSFVLYLHQASTDYVFNEYIYFLYRNARCDCKPSNVHDFVMFN